MKPGAEERVVGELRRSSKYGFLCDTALRRAAVRALAIERKESAAVKRAKRKLHQTVGLFMESSRIERAELLSRGLPGKLEGEKLKEVCLRFLVCHASSAERLGFLDELYAAIRERVPEPRLVLDLACGFHPFGIPWMKLPESCRYRAFDVDTRVPMLLNSCFSRTSLAPSFSAEAVDLEDIPGADSADVVFLLKTLPGLERERKGLGGEIVERLRSPLVVVSFPVRSLSGREKGMRDSYEKIWAPVFRDLGRSVETLSYPTETFYLLSGRAGM